jgi:hypothetical protein
MFSSRCSGTSDWTKMQDFSGSTPQAIQSAAISRTFFGMAAAFSHSLVRACQSAIMKKQSYSSWRAIQFWRTPK